VLLINHEHLIIFDRQLEHRDLVVVHELGRNGARPHTREALFAPGDILSGLHDRNLIRPALRSNSKDLIPSLYRAKKMPSISAL